MGEGQVGHAAGTGDGGVDHLEDCCVDDEDCDHTVYHVGNCPDTSVGYLLE